MPNATASMKPRRRRVVRLFWRALYPGHCLRGGRAGAPWILQFIDLLRVPQAEAVEYLRAGEFDGILAQIDQGGPILEFCRSCDVPVVDLSEAHGDLDVPRVLLDEAAIGRMAGEHFVERGFRHFAFCSAYDHYALAGRLAGFREVVEPVAETFHVLESRPGNEAAIPRPDGFARELAKLPLPLAVMALDDLTAEVVVGACDLAGLPVPEQVAVIGCNNDEHCEACRVRLSSVLPGLDRQAREAVDLLDRLMGGEPPPTEPIRIAPLALAVRESSDIFAVENLTVAQAVRHIIQSVRQRLQVGDVAAAVGVSRAHIKRLFRRYLDCGVAEYIRDMRIRQVKSMLLTSSASIKKIAEFAGFRQASHLSAVFHKATGLSPKQWREQHREDQ